MTPTTPPPKRETAEQVAQEPRMDGTLVQALLWRITALREALRDIATFHDDAARAVARNALSVDDGNAVFSVPAETSGLVEALRRIAFDAPSIDPGPARDPLFNNWISEGNIDDIAADVRAEVRWEHGLIARAALAAHTTRTEPTPAAGWKMVPEKLTPEMKEAVREMAGTQFVAYALALWPTLLLAAPSASADQGSAG